MKGLDVYFNTPVGGMFLWLRMREGIDTVALLTKAVERDVPLSLERPSTRARTMTNSAFIIRDRERRLN
jgi:DNA-binding transcriptional MocR family regulator